MRAIRPADSGSSAVRPEDRTMTTKRGSLANDPPGTFLASDSAAPERLTSPLTLENELRKRWSAQR